MNVFLVLVAFAAIAAANLPNLIKDKLWRDLIIYAVIFLPTLVLGVLVVVGVAVPSPIKAVQALYRDVLHLSFPPQS